MSSCGSSSSDTAVDLSEVCNILEECLSSSNPQQPCLDWAVPGHATVCRPANLFHASELCSPAGSWELVPVPFPHPSVLDPAEILVRGYRAMSNVQEVMERARAQAGWHSKDTQLAVVAATQLPRQPPPEFGRCFLHRLVEHIEQGSPGAVCEELLQARQAVNAPSLVPEACYVNYELDFCEVGGGTRSVQVCTKICNHFNQVGTKTWPAGLFLVELCFTYPCLIQGKRVLELGAGVGITGACIQHLAPLSLCLTDYEEQGQASVMANLRENVHLNGLEGAVRVEPLDWTAVSEARLAALAHATDLVLAADVVYAPQLVPALVRVLAALVSQVTHEVQALVAVPLRFPAVWDGAECLLQELRNHPTPLIVEEVSSALTVFPLFVCERPVIRLYRIRSGIAGN